MRRLSVVVAAMALGVASFGMPNVHAAPRQNGACVGFAGAVGGQRFADVKCYLDSAPGPYVIRATIRERDDKQGYRNLARLPKRVVR